jgi:hypothetical protein
MKKYIIIVIVFFSTIFLFVGKSDFSYTGTFSNLRCVDSEGDILGTEITILSGFKDTNYNYFALVQFAEGVAAIPRLIPITIKDGNFSLNTKYLGDIDVHIMGKITNNSLIVFIKEPLNQEINLARKNSFWSSLGDLCFR